MARPLITSIVPVFNGERYLGEALDSIVAQSYRPLEIIVADDGSTDRSAKIAAAYGKQVRYLYQHNAGTASACNLGLTAARGDFIAFLAADDLWHRDKLMLQMKHFAARPGLDYCVTHVQNFWAPDVKEEAGRFYHHRIAKPIPGCVPQTLLARRVAFETVGHFNIALKHADAAEWFLRASECRAIGELMPDVLVYRRIHQTNQSRVMAAASRDEFLELLKTVVDRRRHREQNKQ